MTATELQDRLARLVPGERLLLPATVVEQAFRFHATDQARREAVATLAWWYGCRVTFCGTEHSQFLFTRQNYLRIADFR